MQRCGLRLLTTFQGLLDQGLLDAVEVAQRRVART